MSNSQTTKTDNPHPTATRSFTERVSVEACKYIVNLPAGELESLFWEPEERTEDGRAYDLKVYLQQVRSFCYKAIQHGGQIKQHYRHSARSNRKGRLYVTGFGIQSLQGGMRNFLCGEYYYDIDMKNAHPCLLLSLDHHEKVHDGIQAGQPHPHNHLQQQSRPSGHIP